MKEIIKTTSGIVKGKQYSDHYVFSSIPYCISKRFEEPTDISWDGIFDATKKQVNCHQKFEYLDDHDYFYYREFDYQRESDYCEDYMTLSITTPIKGEKLPVCIYIHGGSFENGTIEDVPFSTYNKLVENGIIFVSLGYRLNVFGLYACGNYGLKDQVFGIKWIKDNIEAFGGDSDHIVLLGQSAGAMCINDLLLDYDLKGLFCGAIMMSGGGIAPKIVGPKTADEPKIKAFWDKVMLKAGCENFEQLKKVDAKKLWESWYEVRNQKHPMEILAPGLDGEIIKEDPHEIVKKKLDIDVPLVIGTTSQDMFPYVIFDEMINVAKRNDKEKRCPVYCYYFDRIPPGNDYKAYHGCDMWYASGNLEKSWRPFERLDYEISDVMVNYFVNFIKNLNPNGEELPYWPICKRKGMKIRLFKDNKKLFISPFVARLKLYYSFLFDKGPI